jgi:hypothetical protein
LPGTKYILSIYLAVAQRKNEKKTNHADNALFFGQNDFYCKGNSHDRTKVSPDYEGEMQYLFGRKATLTRSENSSDRKTTGSN